MAAEFEFEWQGLAQARAYFSQLAARGERLRPLMADIAEGLLHSTQDRFDAEEDPEGVPWPALAAATLAKKRSDRILVERGYLVGGLRSDFDEGSASVSTAPLSYGPIHQFGGEAGRGKGVTIPARPFLGVSEADADLVLDLARAYLEAPL